MKKLLFASSNTHKIAEISALVQDLNIEILGLADLGVTEDILENGKTLVDNAIIKARYLYDRFGINCFADDTGLAVAALNGAPGVYSARYAGEPKNDQANVAKLLQELETVENRTAQFTTVICYIDQGTVHTFEGSVKGRIALHPEGQEGFGYDPVFIPDDYAITFAQMPSATKNTMSHRARAMTKFLAFLAENP